MKIVDILEAKHHTRHPIIDWLSNAFARENTSHGIYKPLEKEEFDDLHEILPNILGKPIDWTRNENLSWRLSNEHGSFYVDLQNQGGAAPEHSRYRITVAKIEPRSVFEARHLTTAHPWIATFFADFWDPDQAAIQRIPEDLEVSTVVRAFNQQLGQPHIQYDKEKLPSKEPMSYHWKVPIPDNMKGTPYRSDLDPNRTYDFDYSFVDLTVEIRAIDITWE